MCVCVCARAYLRADLPSQPDTSTYLRPRVYLSIWLSGCREICLSSPFRSLSVRPFHYEYTHLHTHIYMYRYRSAHTCEYVIMSSQALTCENNDNWPSRRLVACVSPCGKYAATSWCPGCRGMLTGLCLMDDAGASRGHMRSPAHD